MTYLIRKHIKTALEKRPEFAIYHHKGLFVFAVPFVFNLEYVWIVKRPWQGILLADDGLKGNDHYETRNDDYVGHIREFCYFNENQDLQNIRAFALIFDDNEVERLAALNISHR